MAGKLTAAFLCLFLIFSFAACNKDTDDTLNKQEYSSLTEETVTVSKQELQTDETSQTTGAVSTSAVTKTTAPVQKNEKESETVKHTTEKTETTTAKAKNVVKQTTTVKHMETKPKTETAKPNYTVGSSNGGVKKIYSLVNQTRTDAGMEKLSYRNDLQKAADKRAKELAGEFSHTRPDGRSCFTAIKDAGVKYICAGENIGKSNDSAQAMMHYWMNSQPHRENILSEKYNYTGIAVGCYEYNGYTYYVQIFIG